MAQTCLISDAKWVFYCSLFGMSHIFPIVAYIPIIELEFYETFYETELIVEETEISVASA